jgi:hypothetical protein
MMKWFAVLLALCVGCASAAESAPPAQPESVKGEVLEVKNAGAYTYFRMRMQSGETWAAVSSTTLKKGAQVTLTNVIVMTDFQSRAMDRKFDKIILGTLVGAAGRPSAPGGESLNPHVSVANAPSAADIKVPKATGPDARTVAEIFAKRADLKDTPVLVRGKVVKYTPDVMGRNWIHLRDGSGSAAERTDDLVVTTKAETKVGEVVTAKGVVRTDKDFGSGYAYQVLVEEAGLQK